MARSLKFLLALLLSASAAHAQTILLNKFGPVNGVMVGTVGDPQTSVATITTIEGLLSASPGVVLGGASGGAFGVGTINATGLYINGSAVGIGSGSVTSVGLTGPICFGVTGSPVTAAGSLGLTLTGSVSNFLRANGTCSLLSASDIQALSPTWSALNTFAAGFNVTGGTAEIAGVPIPTYPRSAAEIAASVTPTNYTYPWGNVLRFGADPTGSTDSTTAVTHAHAVGGVVYYPAGNYSVTSGISIPCGGIIGDGPGQTIITSTSTSTANIYNFSCVNSGLFENFAFTSSTMTGGYVLTITSPSGENTYTKVENIYVNGTPNGLSFIAASHWVVDQSNFNNVTGDMITVNNTNIADSGDSSITNNLFNNTSVSGTSNGIHQLESGGLKIIANKFNGPNIGYFLDLGASSTGVLNIVGNSFENIGTEAILLNRSSGSALFRNATITANEFLVPSGLALVSNPSSAFLYGLVFDSNTIQVTASSNSAVFLNYVQTGSITGNNLYNSGAGTTTGIQFLGNNSGVIVTGNNISGFSTAYNPATINSIAVENLTANGAPNQYPLNVNGSSTTGQSLGPLIQAGTNSSDFSMIVKSAGGSNYLYIQGDGGVVVGSPSGADKGGGTLNAGELYDSGVALTSLRTAALDTLIQGQGSGVATSTVAVPNCGSSTQALAYSTSTHTFGCQTISGSGGGFKTAAGYFFCNSSSCSINDGYGIASISRTSVGNYLVTFTTSQFTNTPACTLTDVNNNLMGFGGTYNASQVEPTIDNTSAVRVDDSFFMTCIGS